jgi:hypothetical protein
MMDRLMRCAFFSVMGLALAVQFSAPVRAAQGSRGAARQWESSLVGIEVSRKQYDFLQPWSSRPQTVRKVGLVVGPREILTTAVDLSERTELRVQRGGRGAWSEGRITWVDYYANLALIAVGDSSFWKGMKPVTFARDIPRDGNIQIVRWRAGSLETRKAEFNRFAVSNPSAAEAAHPILELNSEIDGAGWAEPAVAGSKVVGLVYAQTGNACLVLPGPHIAAILEAHRKGTYRGLGYFDFVWQPTENPETSRYLGWSQAGRGVVIIEIPPHARPTSALKPHDMIIEIEGHEIDNEGDYVDPLYGHLMLENLSTRGKWAGDAIRMKVWRDRELVDVNYRLPDIKAASGLIPESPRDLPPEYLVSGGLIFQPLTRNYLRSWGQDWERSAPFRLAYFRNEHPTPERPGIVLLASVLPDVFNLGYHDVRTLVVVKVNGQPVSDLGQLQAALGNCPDGFHQIQLLTGDSLQRIVLDAAQLEAATKRVLERYGVQQPSVIHPASQ